MKKFLFLLLAMIFAMQSWAQSNFTAANGTSSDEYLPVYGYWMDANQHNQIIYPASFLTPLVNSTISKITFHASSTYPTSNWGTNTAVIGLASTTQSNYSTAAYCTDPVTTVFTGTLTVVNNLLEITLTTPFVYSGGNLLVDVVTTTAGSGFYNHVFLDGVVSTGGGISQYSTYSPTLRNFVPKTTFSYTGGTPAVFTSAATSINATSATLNGSYYNMTTTTYGFQYMLASSTDWSTATNVTATTNPMVEIVPSLSPTTTYKFRAFANDGTTNYYGDEMTFTTLAISATLPYTCDFENPTENGQWTFINGTQANQWFIGDASLNPDVNNTLGGYNALFVSNDAGTSWAYSGASGASSSRVYAYRDIEVPVGVTELKLTLDWKANGYGYGDLLRVYWVPTSSVITAGSIPPGALDISNALGTYYNNTNNNITLSLANSWQANEFVINTVQFPTLAGNTWRLLIHWRNENTSGVAQPPATVDNISLTVVACSTPTQLVASNPTINSVDLTWTENSSATTWNIQYKKSSETTWQTVVATTNPYTVTNLDPSTTYNFRVQSDCGSEQSFYTNSVSQSTLCGTISTIPWQYGFEEDFTTNSPIGSTDVNAPLCWININDGYYYYYNWRRTTSPVRNGTGALQFYGGYNSPTSSYFNRDWMITPVITLTSNNRIRFYANSGDPTYYEDDIALYIYSFTDNQLLDITSAADTSLFDVVLQPTIVTSTSSNWQLFEVNLSAYSGDVRLAFVRNNRNGGQYLTIDDIKIDEIPTCPDIDELSLVSSNSNSVTLNWTYSNYANVGFEIAYSNVETGFDPTTATIITVPDGTPLPYTISGLNPAQFYSIAVRQACGGNWSNVVVTNTDGVPATLPYNCDYSVLEERASWKITNGNAPNKFFIGTPSNVIAPINGENLFISNTNGISNNYNMDVISTAVASRLIEFSGESGYRLKFDLYIGGESTYDYIKVFLTDPDTIFTGSNTKPYFAINNYNLNNQLIRNYSNTEPYFNGYNGSSVIAGSYPQEIILPYQGVSGTVKRLIIVWANDGSGGVQPPASIDNIIIEALNCPVPDSIHTSNLTSTSVDINWTDPSTTATEWIFKWKPSSSATWNIDVATSTNFPLTNLTTNTGYNVSIATVCGTDTGVYANFYFATPCIDITIPYSNNFDSEVDFPTCWTRRQYQTYPYIDNWTYSSPSKSLYFYAYNNMQYAATPPVDINTPINTLQVSFKFYCSSTNTPVKVGIMSDPNDMSTFTQIGSSLYASSTYTWEEKIIYLNNYTGNGRFIAILCDALPSNSYSFNIDDFKIEVMPSCPKPLFLSANTTDVTANPFWTEGGSALEWEVEWGLANFAQGQGTLENVTDTFLSLNSLTQNTNYKFYVRAICGVGDTSLWAGPYTFKTQSLTSPPYLEPFSTTTVPVGYNLTEFSVGSDYNNYVPGNPASNIYFNMDSYPGSGNFSTINIGPLSSNYILSFEYKLALYSGGGVVPTGTGYFIVAISTDWGVTYTSVDTVENNGIAGYQNYSLDLSAYDSEIIKIKIIANWISNDYWIGIDNIFVGPPITCPKPQFLGANSTNVSATLFWDEVGNAQEWEIEYDTLNFVHGQGIFASSTDTFLLINNLLEWTDYQFYVRAICGIGDTSIWAGPFTFNTQSLSPIIYFESFASGTVAPAGYMSSTWYLGSPTAVPGNPASNIYVNLYNSTSKAVTTTNIGPLQSNNILQFEYKLANYSSPYAPPAVNSGNFILAISTDWGATFTNIDTVFNNGVAGYQTYEIDLSAYDSEIVQFKITGNWSSGDYYLAVDNIYVGPAITCPTPSALAASNPTTTSINLAWTENGAATTWEVQYGAPGFSVGTGTSVIANTNNPFTVPSLTPSTTYDFYVRAFCGAGDTSYWSLKTTATTACLPFSLPITEGFESSTSIPGCWSTTTTAANYTVLATAGTYPTCTAHGGTNMLYYNSYSISSGNNAVLFSPLLTVTGTPITVSYWQYRDPGYDTYLTEGVEVFYNTNASLTGATSLGFTSRYFATAGWYNITYTIPAGLTGNAYIMFKTNSLYGNNQYIDDIDIHYSVAVCAIPTNLAVSGITSSTANATWTAGGTETQWEIAYKPTAASTWITAIVNTIPSYALPSLTANTPYDVKVRAICGAGDTSAYTAIVNFTTLATLCPAPTGLAITGITNTGASVNWVNGGTETSWELSYKLTAATTWTTVPVTSHPYALTGLTTCSDYDVRVRAMCTAGVYSDYTAVVNFTTPTPAPTNVHIITGTITDQSGTVTWTAGGTETQWIVEYKLASSANWTTSNVLTTTTYAIVNLQSNSTYDVRVKAICGTHESAFTTPIQFTTSGAVVYTITATATGPGTITPSGAVVVNAGANQEFTFTPTTSTDSIAAITVDDLPVTTANSYTFSTVVANHTIDVRFSSVGIEENDLAKLVSIYPNPTSSYVELSINETQLQVKECKVFDIYGKLLKVVPVSNDHTRIDVSDFAAGVYMIRLDSEMGTITKKFVKK
jgi:large repetitive protein